MSRDNLNTLLNYESDKMQEIYIWDTRNQRFTENAI